MKYQFFALVVGLVSAGIANDSLRAQTTIQSNTLASTRNSSTLPSIDDRSAIMKFPVLNEQGDTVGFRDVRAADVWPSLDGWTDAVKNTYAADRGPNTQTVQTWDRELGTNIEDFRIPQDIDQRISLEQQAEAARRWAPLRQVERQRLATSINRNFGNQNSFGVFKTGNFSTEGETESVKVDHSFSSGGFVFGQRITVLSENTRSDSKTKTTRSDMRVFDQSVFVSTDGSVRANRSFSRTRSASKTFVLGIIPVRVQGSVAGSMGANYDYKAEGLGINGNITPFINTRGTASAGIDLLLVVAGIEGSLTFINTTLNSSFNSVVDPIARELRALLRIDNRVNLLSGDISVFAKVRRLFRRDKKFSKSIFTFAGITENRNIINERISVRL